ncbi:MULTISPECIES: hypothetical protein [Bacillus cereus group]|uniref:Uncharacterized protein n=1 Tax=Bacillus thuringiensis TaxID=1428 RepID=A0A1C4FXB5_BACTU|nr:MULTISPECIES: hypothetical protein [Bacillus cereus group]MED3022342.1 hypothetical protein [Bacillus wiedmannii]OTX94441.1 hypothetical protein BK729_29710 [Bacillus thuringiensis serovar wratislaviensis]OUB56204.1 hypothetical protein BK743_21110 [Bacillus thuringiensis serovar sylvestriensis]SCC60649.1 Uncharacterized protein BTT61001_04919 [Bacillus thuringiensis]
MDLTLEGIEKCFNEAVTEQANYVAVQIEMDGFPSDEVIINDKHNIETKLEYYKKTYNEDLEHRYAPGIRIIGYVYGYSFSGIQRELGLSVE